MAEQLEHVKGLAELDKFLETLPVKLQRNIMRGAMRAGMNEVKPVAASLAAKASGQLAAGLAVGTRSRGATTSSNLKTKGPHGPLGPLIEYGTAPHMIAAKKSSALAFRGIFRKFLQHPGARRHPFMRPALDAMANSAVVASGEYIKKRLTKEGLDVRHVMVEGDE